MADAKKPVVFNKADRAVLQDALNKVGTFQEAPGGGKPLPKGSKAPSKEWVEANRKMQPRDENGQFTYNAVNAKGLKYGPSRGTTVSPLLKDVKFTYAEKGSVLKVQDNGKWTRQLMTVNYTWEELVEEVKEYKEEGGFLTNVDKSLVTKKGRESAAEKAQKTDGFANSGDSIFDFNKAAQSTKKEASAKQKEYAKDQSRLQEESDDRYTRQANSGATPKYAPKFVSPTRKLSDKAKREQGVQKGVDQSDEMTPRRKAEHRKVGYVAKKQTNKTV